MNSKLEYIQLEAGEDLPSVRDRLSFIRGRRVLIIWPEVGTVLTRKLDLVLVQREAKRRVIQLALVTHDELVIEHAQELGISTFETIKTAENRKWKRGRTRVFIQRHHKPEHEPEPEELMLVASRVRNPRRRMSNALREIIRLVVLVVVLGVVGGAVYIAAPSAQISLILAQETVSVEVPITADPNPEVLDVDVDNGLIPATVFSATVQTVQSVETTGNAQGADTRAIGVVTFTNQTPRAVEIPVNTLVSTTAGTPIRFQTTVAASLAGQVGARADVAIEAIPDSAGSTGNVAEGMVNAVIGPLSEQITVRNLLPATGGESQSFSVVTEDDRNRLMGMVRAQLQALAFAEMQVNLSETQVIVVESVHIPEESLRSDWLMFSHEMGAISDTVTLNMRAIVEALVIDDRFARQIVFARLSAEKPPRLTLQPDSFLYTRGPVIGTNDNGHTIFTAFGDAVATAQVDTFRLQEAITGQPIDEALRILESRVDLAPDTQPDIRLWPGWLGRMPLLPVRIQFHLSSAL